MRKAGIIILALLAVGALRALPGGLLPAVLGAGAVTLTIVASAVVSAMHGGGARPRT